MVWCHKKKIIFVHIPKTGGTTIESSMGLMKWDVGYGVVGNRAIQHSFWDYYYNKFPNKFHMYDKFAICRNPYDRFVSEYYWCQIPGMGHRSKQTIDQFIEACEKIVQKKQFWRSKQHDHFIPQHMFVYNDQDELMVNHVFRFEDWAEITHYLMRYNVEINKQNTHRTKRLYLTLDQKERVYKMYQKDFELFGYVR